MSYRVLLTDEARDDLHRLYEFIIDRESARAIPDFEVAERALEAIREGLKLLERFPFTCRKVGESTFTRELVISFGHSGYVALFEVIDEQTVMVGAIRHQLEDDYRR